MISTCGMCWVVDFGGGRSSNLHLRILGFQTLTRGYSERPPQVQDS